MRFLIAIAAPYFRTPLLPLSHLPIKLWETLFYFTADSVNYNMDTPACWPINLIDVTASHLHLSTVMSRIKYTILHVHNLLYLRTYYYWIRCVHNVLVLHTTKVFAERRIII